MSLFHSSHDEGRLLPASDDEAVREYWIQAGIQGRK